MRGKILFLPVLAVAAIQLSSCQRKSFDPTLADAFFPLRPGLSWTYRIINNGPGTAEIFTDRVLGRRHAGTGEGGNEVESEYSGPRGTLNSTIIYFPEGGYLTRQSRIDKSETALAERAFLPQQLKPDLSWSNSLVLFDQQPDIFHVTQTHRTFFDTKTIEVPAGHFSGCIRIETEALYQRKSSEGNLPLRLEYLDWYAPHIGLVKTLVEQSGLFGSELARVELLTFGYSQPKGSPPLTISTSNLPVQRSSNPRGMR